MLDVHDESTQRLCLKLPPVGTTGGWIEQPPIRPSGLPYVGCLTHLSATKESLKGYKTSGSMDCNDHDTNFRPTARQIETLKIGNEK